MDTDMNVVLRITNKDTESVRFIATKDGKSITKTYSLAGMTLGAAG